MRMQYLIAALVVTVFLGTNAFLFSDYFQLYRVQLVTQRGDTYKIKVELATTFREKQKGLMYRNKLDVGKGMLFVYTKPVNSAFWMKNMRFPIDIIFIGNDLMIKHIEEKVPPCKEKKACPSLPPSEPIQYVLEVPGGYTKLFKIRPGDHLEFLDTIPIN